MTTTVNNNESKVLINRIGFCGSFYKFLGEDIKIGNQILYPGDYEFDYQIILDDECKNGHLTFSFSEFSFELKESSKFSGNYFYRFVNVLKCLDDWNGNLYFDNLLSFETKVADICFCIYGYDTNKYFDKYSIVTIKPDKLTKIKRDKPIAQYTDDMLELVSLDLSSMTYVVNGDIGTAKNIQSIVLYDEIGKIVVSCDDGKKIECQFDGESILQSVLKEM